MSEKIKNILKTAAGFLKRSRANVAAIALAAVTAGIIIVPPLFRCAYNNGEMNCRTHIFNMNTMLRYKLTYEAENGDEFVQRMIEEGDEKGLIGCLSGVTTESDKFDASDYYFTRSGDIVELRCRKHDKIRAIETALSLIPNININFSQAQYDGKITLLAVEGQSTYKPSDLSDASDKTVFSGYEVNSLINNLTVTAYGAGGEKKELERGDYTVTCDKLDLSAPGGYILTVHTRPRSIWNNTASAKFTIEILAENTAEPVNDTADADEDDD